MDHTDSSTTLRTTPREVLAAEPAPSAKHEASDSWVHRPVCRTVLRVLCAPRFSRCHRPLHDVAYFLKARIDRFGN